MKTKMSVLIARIIVYLLCVGILAAESPDTESINNLSEHDSGHREPFHLVRYRKGYIYFFDDQLIFTLMIYSS